MTLRLTISRAILIFGLVTALGLGAVIATSVYGLSQLKVGGPLYNQIKLGNDLIADLSLREGNPVYKPTPTIDLIFGADDHLIGIAIHGDEALRLLDLLHQISDGHALVSIGGLGDRAQRCSNILPEAGWRQLSSDPRRLIDQAERLTRSRNGIGRTVFQRCGAPPRMQAGSLYPKARFAWPAVRKPPLSRHPALLRHDSPLEGTRFEPPVPPRAKALGPLLEGIDQRRWVGPWIR